MDKRKRKGTGGGIQKQHFTKKVVSALTLNQASVLKCNDHMVLSGCAGTGKTYLALSKALDGLFSGELEKIIIIRSTVPTRDIGFLPGTMDEKCSVYEAPYRQIVNELLCRGDAYDIMKSKKLIEFIPTSFVRGITIDKAGIIVDEAQNMTFHELDSIVTRVGEDCLVIVIGDYKQADLPNNGFKSMLKVLEYTNNFSMVEFQLEDIVRSGFVKDYLIAKDALKL